MKTKVKNCGNYKCEHCSNDGRCMIFSISIDSQGRCILFKNTGATKAQTYHTIDEIDEHTNMC